MTHYNKAMLMSVGSKYELLNTADVLSRANAPAYRNAGIFQRS